MNTNTYLYIDHIANSIVVFFKQETVQVKGFNVEFLF